MFELQGLEYSCVPPAITTGTSPLTHLQLTAAAGVLTQLRSLRIGFTGITAADIPVLVEFLRRSGGTGTALTSAHLLKRHTIDARSIQVTGAYNFSAEPSYASGDCIGWFRCHAQTGYLWAPMAPVIITAATPLCVRVTTASNSLTANLTAELEEVDIA